MDKLQAIETIKSAIAEVEWNYPLDYAIAFDIAIKAIERQNESDWIPCSERLPDEKGEYLVTCNNGKVYVWWFVVEDNLKCWKHEVTSLNPIAWKALPEPFKENKE